MKRSTLTLLGAVLVTAAVALGGCGEQPLPDPQTVIERAFPGDQGSKEPVDALVEVSSLGYEDNALESRLLAIDPETYTRVRRAIVGDRVKPDLQGDRSERSGGLFGLAGNLETVGTEDLDGVEVDHVTGEFDVKKLIGELETAAGSGAASASLPGLGDLDRLRKSLVAADFDLYARNGNDSFDRLDLTLSLDDRQNASPPTRIRFSLSETDQRQAPD